MAQRRTHKKSKLGCQNCKRRHIKCDEGRPACVNCSSTERQCVYLTACPRAVRPTDATSPRSSVTDAGVTFVGDSPSQILLPPMTAQELTPSSFTVSPILTPAPSLQYDATNSSLNIRHMELFSNFMLETMPGLDMNGIVDLGLMRTVMPAILSTPYLLLQVPALSALHLSHTKPMQGISYHADATSLQIEALTSFDEHLGNINSENCDTILMFASLLGTHSLAEAVMTSNSDADGFLDRFVTYLNLHRGVQTVTSQAWALLLQSKISPVLHHASTQLSLAASHTPEQAVLVTEQLSRLLDDGEMSPESNTACRDAVSRLKLMYQADYLEVQCPETKQRPSGLLSAWPVLLSAVYTDLLQKRQPEALIILCYYAVLLHQRRSVWFVGDSGRMLVVSITKSLGSYWRHWLDWPNQVTGDPLVS